MQLSGNTILLTGGSSGIGLALTKRLITAGNQLIITGRRADLLEQVKQELPSVTTVVSDSGSATDRARLAAELIERFPKLNVVINNAGIQRRPQPLESEPWEDVQSEIAINVEGPLHYSALFLKHLLAQPKAAILNVSSGLAFVPIARMAVYSASKAFIHSYTQSLRHQLRGTSVEVIEIIPPAVRSNLGGSHDFGVPTDEYADSVMAQLAEGRPETTYQFSAEASQASRAQLDAIFERLNSDRH